MIIPNRTIVRDSYINNFTYIGIVTKFDESTQKYYVLWLYPEDSFFHYKVTDEALSRITTLSDDEVIIEILAGKFALADYL